MTIWPHLQMFKSLLVSLPKCRFHHLSQPMTATSQVARFFMCFSNDVLSSHFIMFGLAQRGNRLDVTSTQNKT